MEINTENPTRILIVEDDHTIRESLSHYLVHKGHQVETATNGKEGISLLDKSPYDVVISDIMMPEMNGMTFLEESQKLRPGTAVVLITGYSDVKIAIEAMKKGATDFITKPFRYELVDGVVQAIIEESAKKPKIQAEESTKASEQLERKVQELSDMYSINEGLSEDDSTVDAFEFMVEMAQKVTDCNLSLFYVGDPDNGCFYLKSHVGQLPFENKNNGIRFDRDLLALVLNSPTPVFLSGHDANQFFSAGEMNTENSFAMVAPLIVRGEVFGILSVHRLASDREFLPSDASFMQILLRKAALNIENSALYESLYNNLVNTLNSLVQAIEAKDQYTRLHSQRVTFYSCGIAEVLKVNDRDMEAIRFAAPLHDIGKIGISDAILLKKGKVTSEEFERIKSHPELGAKILEPLGLMSSEKAIIMHHHERWEGNGYPGKLKAEEIPFLARIVTVADAYDAMTSDRSYRQALSHEKAVQELLDNRNTQFDPKLVEAFVQYSDKNGLR